MTVIASKNLIYPSSFNNCILSCNKMYNQSQNLLYFVNSCDTLYVQLGFTEKMYNQGETQFYCDHLQARDIGFPFLIIKDLIKYKGETLTDKTRRERLQLVNDILQDPELYNFDETVNEFRLKLVQLFDANEIIEVMDNIIPNFYGITHGIEFFNDCYPTTDTITTTNPTVSNKKNFIMRKTSYPEVYEFYVDGIEKIKGNNIAYIPNLELAKQLIQLFGKRNSIKIQCEYNIERKKWTPIVNMCLDKN